VPPGLNVTSLPPSSTAVHLIVKELNSWPEDPGRGGLWEILTTVVTVARAVQ
jgi:hypothetical protein